jgi:hypothetical protein
MADDFVDCYEREAALLYFVPQLARGTEQSLPVFNPSDSVKKAAIIITNAKVIFFCLATET